jgi:hypothetical protein
VAIHNKAPDPPIWCGSLRFYETSCETRAVGAGAIGAGAFWTNGATWYCTGSGSVTIMRLCEALFSSNLAPAISVRSEPAENERKKNFYREGRIPNQFFLNYSFKLQAFLVKKKMVFGANGLII